MDIKTLKIKSEVLPKKKVVKPKKEILQDIVISTDEKVIKSKKLLNSLTDPIRNSIH